jgi:hypothetical protein
MSKGKVANSGIYYLTLSPYIENLIPPSRQRARPTPIRTSDPAQVLRRLLGARQFRILFGPLGPRFVVGSTLYGIPMDSNGCPVLLGALTAEHPWKGFRNLKARFS